MGRMRMDPGLFNSLPPDAPGLLMTRGWREALVEALVRPYWWRRAYRFIINMKKVRRKRGKEAG